MSNFGEELAHWQYEEYEWEVFAWGEWRRTKEWLKLQFLWSAVPFGLLLAAFTVLGAWGAGLLAGAAVFLFLAIPAFLYFAITYSVQYEARRRWYKRLHRGKREVWIYTESLVIGAQEVQSGLIVTLMGLGVRAGVSLERGDLSMLVFDVGTVFQRRRETYKVLVPTGKEGEAEDVVAAF